MTRSIRGWLKNNEQWMGPIGILIGLVGIIASIYFYLVTRQAGEISLQFNTVKIADASVPSIKIFDRQNNPILGTVFGCEIIIWNTGNLTLGDKSDRMREPLTIGFSEKIKIIDVVVQDTKNVSPSAIKLDRQPNHISITWSQLDQNDAIKLFVIYAGATQSTIDYRGRFLETKITDLSKLEEEQPNLSGLAAVGPLLKYSWTHRPMTTILAFGYLAGLLLCIVMAASRRLRQSRWSLPIAILIGLLFLTTWTTSLISKFSSSNPFQ